jgi:hypothetical protein
MMVGAEEDGVTGWNRFGGEVDIDDNTAITIDATDFIETSESGGIHSGYGTLKVTQSFSDVSAAPNATINVTREYNIPAEDSYTCIMTVRVSVGGAAVRNVRLWIGNRDGVFGDDFPDDSLIGDFDESGVFQPLTTASNDGDGTGKVIKLSKGSEGVFFTSTTGKGVLGDWGNFVEKVVEKDPSTSETSRRSDWMSYGIFLHLGDVQPGETKVGLVAYAAGPLAQLSRDWAPLLSIGYRWAYSIKLQPDDPTLVVTSDGSSEKPLVVLSDEGRGRCDWTNEMQQKAADKICKRMGYPTGGTYRASFSHDPCTLPVKQYSRKCMRTVQI